MAFEENKLEYYYNLPLSNPAMKDGKTIIEIRMPLIKENRKEFEFKMLPRGPEDGFSKKTDK